jgi:hypothetical protein
MPSATDLWFIESRSNPPKSNDRSAKVAEITLYGLYCDYFVLMVRLSNDFSDRIHGANRYSGLLQAADDLDQKDIIVRLKSNQRLVTGIDLHECDLKAFEICKVQDRF